MKGKKASYDKQYSVDNPVNYALLPAISLFFWVIAYKASTGYPMQGDESATPLWNFICTGMQHKSIAYTVGALLMLGGAFLLHRTNYMLAIIREKTIMPFLLYIFFTSSNPDGLPLNPATPGMLCLTLAFYQLFLSYHDSGAILRAFNIGLLIGLGSLTRVHMLWFIPVFWWGMYNFNILSLRTFLASLVGAGVVYWFLLGWCVVSHDFTSFSLPFASLSEMGAGNTGDPEPSGWVYLLFVAFLSVIAIANILLHEHDDSLRTRKYLFFLIGFLIITSVLFFMYRQYSVEFLNIACIPISVLTAHFFTVQKGRKTLRFYYILIILFIVTSLYLNLYGYIY
ncbi:MAG: hypothetical protein LBJ58_03640 [Tannerellaceae bacterium]|jgi:hypothetical protein|nr:hypothetical protein [Tannerellaceae bacterium]